MILVFLAGMDITTIHIMEMGMATTTTHITPMFITEIITTTRTTMLTRYMLCLQGL